MARSKDYFLPLRIIKDRLKEEGDEEFNERVKKYKNRFEGEFVNNWKIKQWSDAMNDYFWKSLYRKNKVCMLVFPKVCQELAERWILQGERFSIQYYFDQCTLLCDYNDKERKNYGFPYLITPVIEGEHKVQNQHLSEEIFQEGRDCAFFYLLTPGEKPLADFVEAGAINMARYDADLDKQLKMRSIATIISGGLNKIDTVKLTRNMNRSDKTSNIIIEEIQKLNQLLDIKRPEDYDKIRIERDRIENQLKCKLGLITLNIPQKKERLLTAETDDAENQRLSHINEMVKNISTCLKKVKEFFNWPLTLEVLNVQPEEEDEDYEVYVPDNTNEEE